MSLPTPSGIVQLALDLGKATFDNTYDSVVTFQVAVEDRVTGLVHGAVWLPGELEAVVDEWIGFLRRTRGDFKGTVDRCYVLVSGLAGGEVSSPGPTTVDTRERPTVARHPRAARRRAPARGPGGRVAPVVQ